MEFIVNVIHVRALKTIHTIQPTNELILKLHLYTQFVITAICFDLS